MALSKKWLVAVSCLFLLAACDDDNSSSKSVAPPDESVEASEETDINAEISDDANSSSSCCYLNHDKTASSSSAKKTSSSSSVSEPNSSAEETSSSNSVSEPNSSAKETSSSSAEENSSSSSEIEGESSSSENVEEGDCPVKNGVKVFSPQANSLFKLGDTVTVVYGSDVETSGYRFLFKKSEDDKGIDLLDESAGPTQADGKSCYEQKVVLKSDIVEATNTAIIRVTPYEKTSLGANSEMFKVVSLDGWSWDVPKEMRFGSLFHYDSMVDPRDQKLYRTVRIRYQVWMAENLNYADSVATPSLLRGSWCYDNEEKKCDVAGRLYSWAAAIDSVALYDGGNGVDCGYGKVCTLPDTVQGICPPGWHLPSTEDWETLVESLDGDSLAALMMKTRTGWDYDGNGDDASGFSALPAGGRVHLDGGFYYAGRFAHFWRAADNDDKDAYSICLAFRYDYIEWTYSNKSGGNSVRCVKDKWK